MRALARVHFSRMRNRTKPWTKLWTATTTMRRKGQVRMEGEQVQRICRSCIFLLVRASCLFRLFAGSFHARCPSQCRFVVSLVPFPRFVLIAPNAASSCPPRHSFVSSQQYPDPSRPCCFFPIFCVPRPRRPLIVAECRFPVIRRCPEGCKGAITRHAGGRRGEKQPAAALCVCTASHVQHRWPSTCCS